MVRKDITVHACKARQTKGPRANGSRAFSKVPLSPEQIYKGRKLIAHYGLYCALRLMGTTPTSWHKMCGLGVQREVRDRVAEIIERELELAQNTGG